MLQEQLLFRGWLAFKKKKKLLKLWKTEITQTLFSTIFKDFDCGSSAEVNKGCPAWHAGQAELGRDFAQSFPV